MFGRKAKKIEKLQEEITKLQKENRQILVLLEHASDTFGFELPWLKFSKISEITGELSDLPTCYEYNWWKTMGRMRVLEYETSV
jgi:hypothetical protein